jgi:hypothetical protein
MRTKAGGGGRGGTIPLQGPSAVDGRGSGCRPPPTLLALASRTKAKPDTPHDALWGPCTVVGVCGGGRWRHGLCTHPAMVCPRVSKAEATLTCLTLSFLISSDVYTLNDVPTTRSVTAVRLCHTRNNSQGKQGRRAHTRALQQGRLGRRGAGGGEGNTNSLQPLVTPGPIAIVPVDGSCIRQRIPHVHIAYDYGQFRHSPKGPTRPTGRLWSAPVLPSGARHYHDWRRCDFFWCVSD